MKFCLPEKASCARALYLLATTHHTSTFSFLEALPKYLMQPERLADEDGCDRFRLDCVLQRFIQLVLFFY